MSRLAPAVLVLVALASPAAAQDTAIPPLVAHVIVDSCSGCGGAALGQAAMAASSPVVIASDQSAVHIVCDSGCGSPPATADNSAFTFGTTSVSPIGFVVDDVAPNAVAENSFGIPRMSGQRILYADLSKTTANATAIKVDNSAVTQPANVTQLAGTATSVNSGTKDAGTLRVVLATDQPQLTNKLLVTPDSVALPANQSVNVAQLAGTTSDTNSGSKSAGTLRVVLATDQPALTNKLLVTPDSVALPANQSVNVAQLAGTTTDTNSGTKSAGTLRVVLATDQPALTNKLLVTPDSVALPANQSVNVAQIAGTNTVTGGVAGILAVGGNVANAVAATANPVPVGGIFTTTPATLTTGQTATMQFTAAQNLKHDLTTVGGTAVSTGTGAGGAGIPRVTVSNDSNVIVTQATLTKGTQGATGVSTQDLKDAGRTAMSFYANAVAAGTTGTETLFTLTKASGTAATSTGTSFTVTSGKRFRITSLTFGSRGHLTATAQITTTSLRVNTAGACIVSSTPIELSAATATPATVQAWDRWTAPLPDGYEILGDGTLTFCVTANAVYTTNAPTWFVNLVGFEY